jgi:ABC-type nitrate/sulfonate/bicarbonate transport system substrate-binding protein
MRLRAIVAALALGAASVTGATAADRPTVHFASVSQEIVPWCLMTGSLYAPDFGPATDTLNIDFQSVMLGPPQAIIAVENGDVQLGDCLGLGTLVAAWKQGARNTVIVAITGNVPAYTLFGSKSIKKLPDFKGKSLASNGMQTTATQAVVDILRRGAGLVPDRDYTLVASGSAGARAAALAAGKIDGITTSAPFTYKMQDAGFPAVATERQYVPNYVQGLLIANRDWAQKNRPVVVAIVKRMLETGRWLKDPKRQGEVLGKMAGDVTMGGDKIGDDYAHRMYADTVAVPGGVADAGYADRALFQTTFDLLVDRGLVARADIPPLESIVDFSYLNEARKQLGMPEVKAP